MGLGSRRHKTRKPLQRKRLEDNKVNPGLYSCFKHQTVFELVTVVGAERITSPRDATGKCKVDYDCEHFACHLRRLAILQEGQV